MWVERCGGWRVEEREESFGLVEEEGAGNREEGKEKGKEEEKEVK